MQWSGAVNGICNTNYLREGTIAFHDEATAAAVCLKPGLHLLKTQLTRAAAQLKYDLNRLTHVQIIWSSSPPLQDKRKSSDNIYYQCM